jgi:hypothetical protein
MLIGIDRVIIPIDEGERNELSQRLVDAGLVYGRWTPAWKIIRLQTRTSRWRGEVSSSSFGSASRAHRRSESVR